MIPAEINCGYKYGEPLAPSADDYEEDYPADERELLEPQYRQVIEEVIEEACGHNPWAIKELDAGSLVDFKRRFGWGDPENYNRDLEVNLERYEDEDGEEHDASDWHRSKFSDRGPLDRKRFLNDCVEHGLDAEDIAAEFDYLDVEETEDALLDYGLIVKEKITIDGEEYRFENYHPDLWRDARILAAFGRAGYSTREIAEKLRVEQRKVERQIRNHNMA